MKPLRPQPLERLVDAEPRFVFSGGEGVTDANGQPVPKREGVGVSFACPIHEGYCRVYVPFTNPIDGGPAPDPRITWERQGETFETLTLTPSIKVLGGSEGCEWHGFIRAGRFETCGDSR